MLFFCQGAGLDFDWALKLVPWYERARGLSSMLMVDSGVRADMPAVAELARHQLDWADVAVNPDVLGDAEATVARTEEWIGIMAGRPQVTLCVCTQGTLAQRIEQVKIFAGRVAWVGAGLACRAPGVRFSESEREDILETIVPVAHAAGLKFHAFGIGCKLSQLRTLNRIGVDSFDSSTPVMIAGFGKVLNENLDQIWLGGAIEAPYRRLLVALSLRNLQSALEVLGARGPRDQDAGARRRGAATRGMAQEQALPGF